MSQHDAPVFCFAFIAVALRQMTVAFILTYVDFRLSRPNRLFYACEKGLGCLDSIS